MTEKFNLRWESSLTPLAFRVSALTARPSRQLLTIVPYPTCATCAYRLFALVSFYRTAMSFNLYAILRELDTLQISVGKKTEM